MQSKTQKIDKYFAWFEANKSVLNASEVCRQTGIGPTTMGLYMAGKRDLPKKHKPVISAWVKSFVKV